MRQTLRNLFSGIFRGVLFIAFSFQIAEAKITLPSVITHNMVLQQKSDVLLWGKSEAGKLISITTGWNNKQYKTTTNRNGDWEIKIKTPSYGGPYNINLSDGERLTLKNVLIGEVWLCSGQSNMEMPLAGWGKINNFEQEIAAAKYPGIRLLQAERAMSNVPLENARIVNAGWQECSPESVAEFSSVAYFFAREIHQKTNIPIGLIHTSWGGTIAEAWTSGESLKKMADFANAVNEMERQSKGKQLPSYREQFLDWLSGTIKVDKGYKDESPVWAANSIDRSGWAKIDVPSLWETSVLPDFDGVVWYRKNITIPESLSGKPFRLSLGEIDDIDITYFNGVQIGKTEGYAVARTYTIPGNLVKSGENTLAVRVLDNTGGGGIYGKPDSIYLESDGEKIPLQGKWEYKIGFNIKDFPAPVQTDGPNRPTVLYNAMIHPFIKYKIKGVIWYQGESNADRAKQYQELFPLLINDWRAKWNSGNFPFYFVQLANFMERNPNPESTAWAGLREAQAMTLSLPNTGMAVSIDIGDAKDIHPKNKQDVGKRLALIALNKNYNKKVEYSGPVLRSQTVKDGIVTLVFDHAKGLTASGTGDLKGFALAGADKKFFWADAKIEGNKVILKSSDVSSPIAVRYGWGNNPDCNLYNGAKLPASPFRTDDW